MKECHGGSFSKIGRRQPRRVEASILVFEYANLHSSLMVGLEGTGQFDTAAQQLEPEAAAKSMTRISSVSSTWRPVKRQ